MTVIDSWTEQESDFQIVTKLDVGYTPTVYATQVSGAFSNSTTYEHQQTCRPKFAYEPSINSIDLEADGTLTINTLFMTNTTGYANCGEMFAKLQVYDENTDTLIKEVDMTNETVAGYQSVQ